MLSLGKKSKKTRNGENAPINMRNKKKFVKKSVFLIKKSKRITKNLLKIQKKREMIDSECNEENINEIGSGRIENENMNDIASLRVDSRGNERPVSIHRISAIFYLDYNDSGCFCDKNITTKIYGEELLKSIGIISRIVVNHEHRINPDPQAKVCHFQCYVKFSRRFHFSPSRFDYNIFGLSFKAWFDLKNILDESDAIGYCRKIDTRIITGIDNHYECNLEEMVPLVDKNQWIFHDFKDFKELATHFMKTQTPNDFIKTIPNIDRIFKINKEMRVKETNARPLNLQRVNKDWVPNEIKDWIYFQYCGFWQAKKPLEMPQEVLDLNVQNNSRTKALVVVSFPLACKTTFFINLFEDLGANLVHDCNTVPEIVYMNGSLDANRFKNKPNARLLILDDLVINGEKLEELKGIVTGQSATISSKYVIHTTEALPCIILLNYNSILIRIIEKTEDVSARYIIVKMMTGFKLASKEDQEKMKSNPLFKPLSQIRTDYLRLNADIMKKLGY